AIWGRHVWLLIYLSSGVLGNIWSCIWSPDYLSIGSSSALSGIIGAWPVFIAITWNQTTPNDRKERDRMMVLVLFAIVLLIGFSFMPMVDWAAHFGGMAAGMTVSATCFARKLQTPSWSIATGVIGALSSWSLFIGSLAYLVLCVEPNRRLLELWGGAAGMGGRVQAACVMEAVGHREANDATSEADERQGRTCPGRTFRTICLNSAANKAAVAAAGCGGAGLLLCSRRGDLGASFASPPAPRGHARGAAVLPAAADQRAAAAAPAAGPADGGAAAPRLAGAALGLGAAAAAKGAWRARGAAAPRTRRRFFGSPEEALENLNPFKESPAESTRKQYQAKVDEINALGPSLKEKSDDELRGLAQELRSRAQGGESLESLLAMSFALVREASDRVLGLRHFDVQLIGGMALHDGKIAEMGTGEGKTLVAILPAFLNALTGKGVHVVTVNDYLARRDAEWVGQPLRFLGLSVGIVQSQMASDVKQRAYRSDVTYVTNSELGFDYLRDQMCPTQTDLTLRAENPFNFCIVDEVDSILIDEARTPLIISGTAQNAPSKYQVAREVAKSLRKVVHYTTDEKQRQCVLLEDGVAMAEKLLNKDDLFDPDDPWFPFIVNALNAKELYVKDKQYIVKKGEVNIVDEFTGRVMEGRRWSNGLHQAVEAKEGVDIQAESVTLASISYQSLFRLFRKLSGMTGTAFTESKEFKQRIYKIETVVIPSNRERKRDDKDDQVFVDDIGKWKAVAREVENAHRIGRPVLIGTTNVENSEILAELLDALEVPYRLLNAKPENVARETEIIAGSGRKYAVTISTNMAGRGTDILLGGNSSMMARLKIREELFPRLFKVKKRAWVMPDDFYPVDLTKSVSDKVMDAVRFAVSEWVPDSAEKLAPTSTDAAAKILKSDLTELEADERLSLACEKAPTDDEAILRLREAYNLMAAEYKEVTDLEKREVIALDGLYVLGTERHESRRIDNQLRGRCSRQGDPGATRFFLSLNDQIFRIFGGDNIKKMVRAMSFSGSDDTPLESGLLSSSLEEAQKKVENYFYSVRKGVFDYDDVMDTQRQIVYSLRRRTLLEDDASIRSTLEEFSDKNMEDFVDGHINVKKPVKDWKLEKLAENVGIYWTDLKEVVTLESLKSAAAPGGDEGMKAVLALLQEKARDAFAQKCATIEESGQGLTGMVTRNILLMQLDNFWQQHLKNMDFLKNSVTLRAYGQKNPLTEYKLEGYQIFLKMMSRIRRNSVYNVGLFTPRKLTKMSKERVSSLIPNREARRRQLSEMLSGPQGEKIKELAGLGTEQNATARTINLARLALNVRQLLDARQSLGELAMASFSELREGMQRAGLITVGDQIRWASACNEFEMFEDEMVGEVYLGIRKGAEVAPDSPLSPEERLEARQNFGATLEDPEFLRTVGQFATSPSAFLAQMKEAAGEQGWTAENIQRLRETYAAAGVDIDEMMAAMSESSEAMPPEQREVVEYMQGLFSSGAAGVSSAEKKGAEKVKV
ncbi:unnamed protein product, partial [Prorocentrum cordatum]